MRNQKFTTFLIAAAALAIPGAASAQNTKAVYLRAGVTTMTMPDTSVVTMWGYALDSSAAVQDGTLQVPGPVIQLALTDSTLLIHLKNALPEASSVVVPGLTAVNPGTPTRGPDGRALSLVAEAPPGGTRDYSFQAKPGSFLYHSGSHIQVQVQMGLYGAIKRDFSAGVAYAGTTAYTQDVVLVLSEIDPALHQAVASGHFGLNQAVSSTVNYAPRYFLVNGKPFDPASPLAAAAPATKNTLLRIYNAAITTRIPTLLGQELVVLSDSGNKLPFAKTQYSLMLPALQTTDALVKPSAAGTLTLFDRGLGLSNGAGLEGGMTVKLSVAAAPPAAAALRSATSRRLNPAVVRTMTRSPFRVHLSPKVP